MKAGWGWEVCHERGDIDLDQTLHCSWTLYTVQISYQLASTIETKKKCYFNMLKAAQARKGRNISGI